MTDNRARVDDIGEDIESELDTIVSILSGEDPEARAAVLERLTEEEELSTETIETLVPYVCEAITAEAVTAGDDERKAGMSFVSEFASTAPQTLLPAVEPLVSVLTETTVPGLTSSMAAQTLKQLRPTADEELSRVVEVLIQDLNQEWVSDREFKANDDGIVFALSFLALVHPSITESASRELALQAETGPERVRESALGALAALVEDGIALDRKEVKTIIDRLDDDAPTVRKEACKAVVPAVKQCDQPPSNVFGLPSTLERLAEEDPDEEVRTAAQNAHDEWMSDEDPNLDSSLTDSQRMSEEEENEEGKPFQDRVKEIGEQRRQERSPDAEESATAAATGSDEQSPLDRHVPDEIPGAPAVAVDYESIVEEGPIGSGGNADVIRATLQTAAGETTLAIKKPRLSGTLHTDRIERMLEEARTWDKLDDHDHIVGVVGYGDRPLPWIAMEYMDGGHLGTRGGEMDLPQALWTALAVTKAVRYAHLRGVVHLDIKPENILLRTVDDAWDVPKVADWGLSKHLLDHSKSVDGVSPTYAAPEQFDETYGATDNVTDVYQLGAVFYELFTGQPPFEGSPTRMMRAVLDDQPTPPSEVADVPPEVDDVVLRALEKEKSDRYEDVLYLRDELESVFQSRT